MWAGGIVLAAVRFTAGALSKREASILLQHAFDLRSQLAAIDRFYQLIGATSLDCGFNEFTIVLGREHQDGGVFSGFHRSELTGGF